LRESYPETKSYLDDLGQAEMVDAEGEGEAKGDGPKKGRKVLKKIDYTYKKAAKKRFVFQGEDDE